NSINPADLMDARDVNQGAPVIRNDGVVLNGNGRTAAIRYAYANGKGEAYKNALVGNAKRLGLNADEISKMNQPVLVREITSDLTPEAVQDITGTQTGGARMGASEQAQVDAKKLSRNTLTLFPQNDSVDLTNAESSDFLRAALNDIATLDEINSLTTSNGQISQDGINRVKRALFALAYGDEGLIARMSESTDDNVRGVTNALLNAAPTIAKVQAGMKDGVLHKYDLKAIVDTVKKLSALRDAGKPVSKYLQEQSLFGEDSAEMKEILSFIDKNNRAPNKIAAFLKQVASNIQEQGDPRQGSLFGENKSKPLIDLIKRAREAVENNGEADLFTQEQPAPQKTAPKELPAQKTKPAKKTKRSEKAQKLYAKYKTDTHPLIGAHLDKVLERAKSKENTLERTAALKELKLYEKRDVTDEWLNETEAKLQKRENELDNQSDTEPTEQEDSVAPSGRKRNSSEVFTSPEGVARILDSAEEETPDMFTNPALTYLDPAAGEGAITTAVLQRKLNSQARKTSGTTNSQLQRNMLKALSSVYSVELHADNVAELKKNMQKVFLDHYREQTGEELNKDSPLFKKM
ncbi:MAG: hypothetical protein IKG61_09280, partial [Selenomonadaceae bacterium]|nr:hypothetical protein [Selenomonadaceae bacterium]